MQPRAGDFFLKGQRSNDDSQKNRYVSLLQFNFFILFQYYSKDTALYCTLFALIETDLMKKSIMM